jgi:hypothetical protein
VEGRSGEAGWAALEGRGRLGRKGRRGGREKKKVFPFSLNLDEQFFNNFNQPKQMHDSAWCRSQNKVFLGFCFTRDLKPNLAITLEKVKA